MLLVRGEALFVEQPSPHSLWAPWAGLATHRGRLAHLPVHPAEPSVALLQILRRRVRRVPGGIPPPSVLPLVPLLDIVVVSELENVLFLRRDIFDISRPEVADLVCQHCGASGAIRPEILPAVEMDASHLLPALPVSLSVFVWQKSCLTYLLIL